MTALVTTLGPHIRRARPTRDAQRTTARRDVQLLCQAVRERDFKLVADCILDVSIEGALLPLRIPVITGESLILSFQIPGMWIDVEATVARVIHGRRPEDDGPAVGIVFESLSASAKAALAAFVHERRKRSAVAKPASVAVDGLGIFRAMLSAWQDLADAQNTSTPLLEGCGVVEG